MNQLTRIAKKIGALTGGSVYSIEFLNRHSANPVVMATTNVGIWHCPVPWHSNMVDKSVKLGTEFWEWQPLPDMPAALTAMAISPDYDEDTTLLVGAQDGVYLTSNEGNNWRHSSSTRPLSSITVIKLSPNFVEDGVAFLGTLEDGIFVSRDRGMSWFSSNFGLYDLAVYCLAVSPNFTKDGTLFAGAASGLYYSYNGGRAWRELESPAGEEAILAIAISPNFARDGTLFIGAEHSGVFCSRDHGNSWEPASKELAHSCINALAVAPEFPGNACILCATDEAIYQSDDAGQNWRLAVELPGVQCLSMTAFGSFAGLWEGGIYFAPPEGDWQPAGNLPGRALMGFAPAPSFIKNGEAVVFGEFEGLHWTSNGGKTWQVLDFPEGEEVQVRQVLLNDRVSQSEKEVFSSGIVVATTEGVWKGSLSDGWTCLLDSPTYFIQGSPDGSLLIASTDQGLQISRDGGQTWQLNYYPWQPPDVLLDCTSLVVTGKLDESLSILAVLESGSQKVVFYSFDQKGWQKVASILGVKQSAQITIPQSFLNDGEFYVALDQDIYSVNSSTRKPRLLLQSEHPILSLTSLSTQGSIKLMGISGTKLQGSEPLSENPDGQPWATLYNFSPRQALAITVIPSTYTANHNSQIFVLTLGGELWQLAL